MQTPKSVYERESWLNGRKVPKYKNAVDRIRGEFLTCGIYLFFCVVFFCVELWKPKRKCRYRPPDSNRAAALNSVAAARTR